MRYETAIASEAVFAVNQALSFCLFPASHRPESFLDSFLLHFIQLEALRHAAQRFPLPRLCRGDRTDPHQRAERQVQAQQDQQKLEIPASEHIVELQHQKRAVKALIGLRVPGDLPSLGNRRPHHGEHCDQAQQDDPKAHGAKESNRFFHSFPLFLYLISNHIEKRPPSPAGTFI